MINKRAIRNEFCEVDVKHSKSSERSTNKDDLMHLFWINKNKKVKLESLNILCIGIKADNHYTLCSIFVCQEKKWRRSLTSWLTEIWNIWQLTLKFFFVIRWLLSSFIFLRRIKCHQISIVLLVRVIWVFFFQRVRISK